MAHVSYVLGATAVAAGLALSACTPATVDEGGSSGSAGGNINLALPADPTTFDPQLATASGDFVVDRLVYDPLLRRDTGGKLIEGLATKWSLSEDAKTASFTVRDDVTCSDGTELTPTHIANSIKRYADPKTGSASAAQVFGVGNKVTVTADDAAHTVTVALANPWSDLLFGLALPQAGIICPAGLEDPALLKSGGKGAGSGPYFVKTSKPGDSYVFTAHAEHTWEAEYADQPEGKEPSQVTVKIRPAEATMANELQTGTVDYAGLTGPDAARFVDKDGFATEPAPIIRNFVVFNHAKGRPGADPAFRKAVAQVLDRDAFNQAVSRGSGVLLASIADESVPYANTDESLLTPADAKAAAAVLKGVKVRVVGTNAVAGGAGNSYVQAVLEKAGAKVELANVDNASWSNDVMGNKGDWDISIQPQLNLTNLLTTPASFFVGPTPAEGGRNFSATDNPGFAKGFQEAMVTTDAKAKAAAWATAQKALLEANDVVPLATVNVNYVTSTRIGAVAPDGLFAPESLRIVGDK